MGWDYSVGTIDCCIYGNWTLDSTMTNEIATLDVSWRNRCERILTNIVNTKRQSHEYKVAADLMLTALNTNPKRDIFIEVADQLETDGEIKRAEIVRELTDILEDITSVDFKLRNPPPILH